MIPAQGLQNLPIEDFSAGQRTTGTFFSRTPSAPRTQNMVSYVDKLLRKRPGYDTEGIPAQGTEPITGIYEYKLDVSNNFQMMHTGMNIYYMQNFNKVKMYELFLEKGAKTKFYEYVQTLEITDNVPKPIDDLIDAYWTCEFLRSSYNK